MELRSFGSWAERGGRRRDPHPERERCEPPDASNLSGAARELLRSCIARGYPGGDETNRPAYRELVKARIMMPMGSFSKGDECVFRFTYWGHKLRFELTEMSGA
jgi:hypothetical protein